MLLLKFLHNYANFNLYKKWILILAVGTLLFLKTANASLGEFTEETVGPSINTSFLDWSKRPGPLTKFVNERFDYVTSRFKDWGLYPGNNNNGFDYCVMGVPDPILVHNIILQNPEQRLWFFIDMGSGNGCWGRTLMDYLARQFANELNQDTKAFHILNLTGDSYLPGIEETPTYTSKIIGINVQLPLDLETPGCIIYDWTHFPIEYLMEKLKSIQGHVDAIFSFAALRHCADGLGTYAQAFDLLKDEGFLVTDSDINALLNGNPMGDLSILLPQLSIPCLTYEDIIKGVMAQKIMGKSIPQLTYSNLREAPGLLDTYSTITSPCHVNYVGDLKSQEIQELTVVDAYIPGLLGRRNDLKDIRLTYNEDGHAIFKNIFYGAVLGIQDYLNDTKNTNNEFGISRYLSLSLLRENERLRQRFPQRAHEIDDNDFLTPTVHYN